MIVLRLAGGGRIAVRPEDVALAQTSPWGAIILIASDGSRFEVEQNLVELRRLIPSLWLTAGNIIISPEHISSIWENMDTLSYLVCGVHMTQHGANLHDWVNAIEEAREQRRKMQLSPSDQPEGVDLPASVR